MSSFVPGSHHKFGLVVYNSFNPDTKALVVHVPRESERALLGQEIAAMEARISPELEGAVPIKLEDCLVYSTGDTLHCYDDDDDFSTTADHIPINGRTASKSDFHAVRAVYVPVLESDRPSSRSINKNGFVPICIGEFTIYYDGKELSATGSGLPCGHDGAGKLTIGGRVLTKSDFKKVPADGDFAEA